MLLLLPGDLVDLILYELYYEDPKSLNQFRLVSRTSRERAEPLFYRTICLYNQCLGASDEDEDLYPRFYSLRESSPKKTGLEITKATAFRLANPEGGLAQYVRHLYIGPFDQHISHILSDETLVAILRNLRNLKDFYWATWAKMPTAVLQTFQEVWPRVRLHITNFDRGDERLDTQLLACPQLYSLSIIVRIFHQNFETYTEYRHLTDAIAQSSSLRILKLMNNSHFGFSFDTNEFNLGPPRLYLESDDITLPPLEEIKLPDVRTYILNSEYCLHWKQKMNWNALKRLDVGTYICLPLLKAITGEVPNLMAFSGGFNQSNSVRGNWDDESATRILKKFFASLQALEQLCVQNEKGSGIFKTVWVSILNCHGASLRKLKVLHTYLRTPGWDDKKIAELVAQAPSLNHLTIELESMVGTTQRHTGEIWPENSESHLAKLSRLQCLTLYVKHVDNDPQGNWNMERERQLENKARTALANVFNAFLTCNPLCALERVQVCLRDSMAPVQWRIKARRVGVATTGEVKVVYEKMTRRGNPNLVLDWDPFG